MPQMNIVDIEIKIREIISRDLEVNVARVEDIASKRLDELFGLDSIAMLELILSIEKEFDLMVPVEDLTAENFRSIKAIAEMVQRLI